ncbi:hypothetical protein ES703_93474 [subsurface metagenome]
MVETTEPAETKVKDKIFRLKPEEDAQLPSLIEFAHKAGYITKPTLQEFMVFCINCAFTRLKGDYEARKGRR